MKTAQITLQIEPALKAAAEKAAAEADRSLNGLIEKLLTDYCKKRDLANEPSSSHTPAKGAPESGLPRRNAYVARRQAFHATAVNRSKRNASRSRSGKSLSRSGRWMVPPFSRLRASSIGP
jgi:hypothetical protein